MFGIHIPNMCRTVKSKHVRELFKQINVGYVGPIIIKFSPDSNNFDNYKQSATVYFRKFHDIPRSHEFKDIIMDPNKNLFVLHNNHYFEFKPIEVEELYMDYL